MLPLVAAMIVAVAVATAISGALAQQTYPARTVRLVLPFGAASATDTTARLLADRLSTRWGKPVVVENRPGGDGLVALNAFLGAHDDHTLSGRQRRFFSKSSATRCFPAGRQSPSGLACRFHPELEISA